MSLGAFLYMAGTVCQCIALVQGAPMSAVGISLVVLGGTMLLMVVTP